MPLLLSIVSFFIPSFLWLFSIFAFRHLYLFLSPHSSISSPSLTFCLVCFRFLFHNFVCAPVLFRPWLWLFRHTNLDRPRSQSPSTQYIHYITLSAPIDLPLNPCTLRQPAGRISFSSCSFVPCKLALSPLPLPDYCIDCSITRHCCRAVGRTDTHTAHINPVWPCISSVLHISCPFALFSFFLHPPSAGDPRYMKYRSVALKVDG